MNKQEKSLGLKKQWYTKDQEKETTVVWTRGTDGGEKTTKWSFAWTGRQKKNRGRQRKTWMDNVREDLKEKNIDLTCRIYESTKNREVWRNLVYEPHRARARSL